MKEEEKQQLEADIRQSIDPKSDTGLVLQKVAKQVGFPQECSTEKEGKKPQFTLLRTNSTTELPPQTTGKKPDSPEKQGHKSNSHFRGKKKSSSSAD